MNLPFFFPSCGTLVVRYSNPLPTADVVIHDDTLGIVLIRRKNPPLGMALPGGFIEEGESAEHAAVREMKEETGLDIILEGVLGVYSWPLRDMRCHTLTTVFVGHLCFDHARIIAHFRDWKEGRRPLLPCAEDPSLEYGDIPYTRPF